MVVPRLTTALKGPLHALERHILEAQPQIEHWLRAQWYDHTAPFYGSVDLRNSGFKLALVDMNLFPGGFNNLNPDFTPSARLTKRSLSRPRWSAPGATNCCSSRCGVKLTG